jgi:hypothetical protein
MSRLSIRHIVIALSLFLGMTAISSGAGAQSIIVNGGFEDGPTGWTEYSSHGWALIFSSADLPVTPHGGDWGLWLGGGDDEVAYVEQQVDLPPGELELTYWRWIASDDSCGYDFGTVRVNGTIVQQFNLCNAENTQGWQPAQVDLTPYAGQTAMIQFRAETDVSAVSNLYIDDVVLESHGALFLPLVLKSESALPPSPQPTPEPTATPLPGGGINNGDFESGQTGWTEYESFGWLDLIRDAAHLDVPPHGGNWAVRLGGHSGLVSYIHQTVTVPGSSPYLGYWRWIDSDENASLCHVDIAQVLVDGSAVEEYGMCATTNTSGWEHAVLNLSAYAGQSVALRFRTETDSSIISTLYIDDVAFQSSP